MLQHVLQTHRVLQLGARLKRTQLGSDVGHFERVVELRACSSALPAGLTLRPEVVRVDGVVPIHAVEQLALVVDHERVDVLAVAKLAQEGGEHQLQQIAGAIGHLAAAAVAHELQKEALE